MSWVSETTAETVLFSLLRNNGSKVIEEDFCSKKPQLASWFWNPAISMFYWRVAVAVMSIHLLTAQIVEYFCLLFTLPRDHPFPPGNMMWGQEVGHIRRQLQQGLLQGAPPALPDTLASQGSVGSHILPILDFFVCSTPLPKRGKKKITIQRGKLFHSLSGTKYQELTGFSLQLWFHFKVLKKKKNIILYRHIERSYWKVLSRLSGNTSHHVKHPIGFLTLAFSIGCCWVFGAS